MNWTHASTIRDVSRVRKPTREERLDKAHDRALPFLEDQFSRRSVLPASEARIAAARGLIAAGIDTDEDVGAVTALMRERGIRQDGRRTELVWGRHGDIKGQERWYITTGLHVAQERELIRLTRRRRWTTRSPSLPPKSMPPLPAAIWISRPGTASTSAG